MGRIRGINLRSKPVEIKSVQRLDHRVVGAFNLGWRRNEDLGRRCRPHGHNSRPASPITDRDRADDGRTSAQPESTSWSIYGLGPSCGSLNKLKKSTWCRRLDSIARLLNRGGTQMATAKAWTE